MTHLQGLCELKRYLCYICSFSLQVILGRLQWSGTGGVVVMTSNTIVHPDYNPWTLANDVALLLIPSVTMGGEYPSPVSLMLLCVYCGHM